jgi:hypothetical protein
MTNVITVVIGNKYSFNVPDSELDNIDRLWWNTFDYMAKKTEDTRTTRDHVNNIVHYYKTAKEESKELHNEKEQEGTDRDLQEDAQPADEISDEQRPEASLDIV